jgi:hypothetical protein
MPFFSNNAGHKRNLVLAGAVTALLGAAAGPAFAGDDGQAPIWSGIGDLIGVTGLAGIKEVPPPIDYRERGRLVLPPTMTLPPPVAPGAEKNAAWPVDPDLEKARKAREDKLKILSAQSDTQTLRDGRLVSPEKLRADHSGPGASGPASHCSRSQGCNPVPFRNVFETIGLVKPDEVVAGQEPDRDWLTDPPKGFRLPTTNTAAKFDQGDAKKPNDSDPRAALYNHPNE